MAYVQGQTKANPMIVAHLGLPPPTNILKKCANFDNLKIVHRYDSCHITLKSDLSVMNVLNLLSESNDIYI